jgi:hypothetical protein
MGASFVFTALSYRVRIKPLITLNQVGHGDNTFHITRGFILDPTRVQIQERMSATEQGAMMERRIVSTDPILADRRCGCRGGEVATNTQRRKIPCC